MSNADTAAGSSYEILGAVLRDSCLDLMTEYGLSSLLQVTPEDATAADAANTASRNGRLRRTDRAARCSRRGQDRC